MTNYLRALPHRIEKMEILKHEGKPVFVVMPYDEYIAMVEQLEDKADTADYYAIRDAIKRGDEELIPEEVVKRLLEENPIKVWREYRKMKQKELADRVGITSSMLSQIEKNTQLGSLKTLKNIAKALSVDLDDIT